MLLEAVISIVVVYFLIFFVLSRMFVPYLGKSRPKIGEIPASMKQQINRLKKKYPTKKKFAKAAYDYLTGKYRGGKIEIIRQRELIFMNDLKKSWNRSGFLPCNQLAYLYYVFLVKSGLYSRDEVSMRITWCNFNIHRYVHLKLAKEFDVDIWGAIFEVPYGKHARGLL